MKTSKDRYLTTFVGSLVRPQKIVDYTAKIVAGESYDRADYEATLRSEVARVVKEEAATGLDVVSDGEFGKSSWTTYTMQRLGGFEVLGLVGVVIGPVLLALARELWEQHVRELALLEVDSSQTADRGT